MARTYAAIHREIEALQRKAQALRSAETRDVIARIKEAIAAYGLTASDLGLAPAGKRQVAPAKPAKGKGRPAKYRDGDGNTWGGRGPRPQWLRDALAAGKSLDDFAV